MDDALLVRRFERLGDLLRDRQRFVERDRAARDALREIVALDQFHHERAVMPSAFFEAVDGAMFGWFSEASDFASRWKRASRSGVSRERRRAGP